MSRKPLVIRPLKPKEQQTINRERLMVGTHVYSTMFD